MLMIRFTSLIQTLTVEEMSRVSSGLTPHLSTYSCLNLHCELSHKDSDSPAVLHVGGFVHADGQLDLQIRVLTVLGDDHPVELGLLRPVCGRVQDDLRWGAVVRCVDLCPC